MSRGEGAGWRQEETQSERGEERGKSGKCGKSKGNKSAKDMSPLVKIHYDRESDN